MERPHGAAVGTVPPMTFSPGPGFPGETAVASNAAFVSGRQPASLELWPRADALAGALALGGGAAPPGDLSACWSTTVLLDLATGWTGHCLQLEHKPAVATITECQDIAFQDPTLPVWQYNNHSGCWQGVGRNCNTGSLPATIVGSQRLQHGAVRVLKDMTGWHVHDLHQLGIFNHGSEVQDIERCRSWCYSSIFCEYWQYGQGGCWVDDADASGSSVSYPLVIGEIVDNNTNWARTSVAGEYIQHYCPAQTTVAPAAAVPPLAPPDAPWLSPWQLVLIGLAVLAFLGVVIYACTVCMSRKKPKTSRSRAVKPSRRDAQPPASPRVLERQGEAEPMIGGLSQIPQLAQPVLAFPMPGGLAYPQQISTDPRGMYPPQQQLALQQFAFPGPPQAMMNPQYRGAVP